MRHETEAACLFWGSCLDNSTLSSIQVETFINQLGTFMQKKYANHWYVNNPLQGQAYRSLVCDIQTGEIDQLLLDAAAAAGFSFTDLLHTKTPIRMWVDPGEVEVETRANKRTQIYPQTYDEITVEDPVHYYSQPYDDNLSPFYSNNAHSYDQGYSFYTQNTIQDSQNWNYTYSEPSYDVTSQGVYSTA